MDVGALWGFLYENSEAGIVERQPPGKRSSFITREMMYSISTGAAGIFLAVTAVYLYLYYAHGNIVQAQMGAFATWILSQVILAQNLRTEYQPVIRKGFFSNPIILAWGIIIVGMLVTDLVHYHQPEPGICLYPVFKSLEIIVTLQRLHQFHG